MFCVLGGDLFHENNPSRETRIRVNRIFRKYVFDGAATELECMSRPEDTFGHSSFKCVNFEDANYGIAMPVFTIHGNHDDLSGTVSLRGEMRVFYNALYCNALFQSTSELDALHEVGLLNLYGRFQEVDVYECNPILLRKPLPNGTYVQLALYGISSQRDDRLARAFGCMLFKLHLSFE